MFEQCVAPTKEDTSKDMFVFGNYKICSCGKIFDNTEDKNLLNYKPELVANLFSKYLMQDLNSWYCTPIKDLQPDHTDYHGDPLIMNHYKFTLKNKHNLYSVGANVTNRRFLDRYHLKISVEYIFFRTETSEEGYGNPIMLEPVIHHDYHGLEEFLKKLSPLERVQSILCYTPCYYFASGK